MYTSVFRALMCMVFFSLVSWLSCPASQIGKTTEKLRGSANQARLPDGDLRVLDNHQSSSDISDSDGGVENSFEDVSSGRAVDLDPEPLYHFFESLRGLEKALEKGKDTGDEGETRATLDNDSMVRILHYGDSHTAADFLPSAIRRSLQNRFGDKGRGFVLLGQPWKYYVPRDIALNAKGKWNAQRILLSNNSRVLDGRYGLAGVAVESKGKASAFIEPIDSEHGGKISTVDVFYMKQPKGGTFTIFVEGKKASVVKTSSKVLDSGFQSVSLGNGEYRVEIKTWGNGTVRLFGAAVENNGPGIVYDTLGINGAFFQTPLSWDETILSEQIEHRKPSLIIAMYGSNEVNSKTFNKDKYRLQIKEVIAKFRSGAPDASCLLIGPPDRDTNDRNEDLEAGLGLIIDTQRETADEESCAFIDTYELMGGQGSFEKWNLRGLFKSDGIHLTNKGYEILGEMLSKQLLAAYEQFLLDENNPVTLKQGADE